MITPISSLDENTKCLAKINNFCGSTVVYSQNLVGDWTEMTTIKWPIFIILLITCMWIAPYAYVFIVVYKGEGYIKM